MFRDYSHFLHNNPPARQAGIAVADVDGDGRDEFIVCGFQSANRILKWRNGRLEDAAPAAFSDPEACAAGIAAADIDGDGREEIYILQSDVRSGVKLQPDRLFKFHRSGRCEDLFSRPDLVCVRNVFAGRSVAAMDRRGTGRYGFLALNHGQPCTYYEVLTGGRIAELGSPVGLDRSLAGSGLWVGPLLADRPEIFCLNEAGPNLYFRPTADYRYEELGQALGLQDAAEHGSGVAAFDADGDGRLDLVWGNWEGPHRLMIRQADGTFQDRATPALALPGTVRNVVAADFDNDGREEVFFNHQGEPNRVFRFPPDHECRLGDCGSALEPDGLGTGAAIADIDGDGVLELLISHGEHAPQPLSLYKAAESQGHWLRVRPLTRFGAPARGAVVRLRRPAGPMIRVIDGGSGYLCQMEPVAHFGLGADPLVESLRVTWPDGASVIIAEPAVRRTLVVEYPL